MSRFVWEVRNGDTLVFNPDEASLDLFWLRDEFDNRPDPDVLAQAIIKQRKPDSNGSAVTLSALGA
jgi:hypothetical protein